MSAPTGSPRWDDFAEFHAVDPQAIGLDSLGREPERFSRGR
jgi:hypothetical protein